jgi:hypothetical protein
MRRVDAGDLKRKDAPIRAKGTFIRIGAFSPTRGEQERISNTLTVQSTTASWPFVFLELAPT